MTEQDKAEVAAPVGPSAGQLLDLRARLEVALTVVKTLLEARAKQWHDREESSLRIERRELLLSGKESHDRLQITDETALRRFLAGLYPTEYVTKHQWVPINPGWEANLLEACADRGGYLEDGTLLPGTTLVEGGSYAGTSLTWRGTYRRDLTEQVLAALVNGTLTLSMETDDERPVDHGSGEGVAANQPGAPDHGPADEPPAHPGGDRGQAGAPAADAGGRGPRDVPGTPALEPAVPGGAPD